MKRLHVDEFRRGLSAIKVEGDNSNRQIKFDTQEKTGQAVYNVSDLLSGETTPTQRTWEVLHETYPEYMPPPTWIDEDGDIYALSKIQVKGKIKTKGDNNTYNISVSKNTTTNKK